MLFGYSRVSDNELCFYVGNGEHVERIAFYTAENGLTYIFLPSYAELDHVTVVFPENKRGFIGDVALKSGDNCSAFSLNQKYEYQLGRESGILKFYQSANMPTLYIETASGSMDAIYADKEHEEIASITLYSPTGEIEYADRSCLLKGRGNSTWRVPKKPFLLRLSDAAGLLGMAEDTDWVLLANSHDESNLHNKLLLDLADRVCEEWTPRCEYIDIYLNGQYNGLYLLTEKVESGKNRLDIDIGAGDFLCTVDFAIRTEILENPFLTKIGRTIAICEPGILSAEAKERIIDLVNQQEEILLSQMDLTQSQLVDIDSWIRKYLMDEIAGNLDSDMSSSYFYYSDGVFHGGPVWDYDMAFGNTIQTHYPKAFIAKNYEKYGYLSSPYYNALFNNDSCTQRMAELFERDFLPVLNQMIDHDVQYTADQISSAAAMNQSRWPLEINEHPESTAWGRYVNTTESIVHFLKGKTELLSNVLIKKEPYCTVQFEHSEEAHFWTVSVPRGSVLAETDIVNEPLYSEVNDVTWMISGTTEIFDPGKPILEDMVLRRVVNG